MPVVRLEAYGDKPAWIATYMAGTFERLEHELRHEFPDGLWVHKSFPEQDGVVLRHNPELVEEGVVPDFLHVIPIRDEIVRNGILHSQNTALVLRLVTNKTVFLVHGAWHIGPVDDRRKLRAKSTIASKSGLAHGGHRSHQGARG